MILNAPNNPFARDKFLFECYQTIKVLKTKESASFLFIPAATESLEDDLMANSLKFKDRFLHNMEEEEISDENIFNHIFTVARIIFTMQAALLHYHSQELPTYPSDEEPMPDVWKVFIRVLNTQFNDFYPYALFYLKWAYRKTPAAEVKAPHPNLKTTPQPSYNDEPRASHSGRPGRPPRRSNDKYNRNDRNERSDRSYKKGRNDRRNWKKDDRNRSTKQQESDALLDAKTKLNKLRSDQDLAFIKLEPVNSYLRRLQHKYVIKNGFFSYSDGEAKERAISIYRRPKED